MLIVGLGNPGRRYARTRHNVGFDVLDAFARNHHTRIGRRMARAVVGRALVGDQEVFLAKPHTFMNLSGEAVREICRRLGVNANEITVVYDDLDLPVGKMRIRPKGSAGGHKGMASIIGYVGTNEFPRVRIGIGRDDREAVEYVLSRFRRDELPIIREAVARAAEALDLMLREGVEAAMNMFN